MPLASRKSHSDETVIANRRPLLRGGLWVLAGVAAVWGLYVFADPEKRDIDESVRAAASGQFARLSDGYTHYELGGPPEAPAVVLAAGVSVPYYIWDPTFAALVRAGFRVLRYDYYGRGFSDRPDIAYSQDAYLRQLSDLLDAARIAQPVHLVGLSFGGSVAASFADRRPDRVRSLVFVDPAFRSPSYLSVFDRIYPLWNYKTAVFEERWWADAQLGDFLHPERYPDWPDRYREQIQYRGFRWAQHSTGVTNAGLDQGPELKRVGSHPRPVLVIWGKQDQSVPFEFSAALLQAVPRARLVAIEDAGHLPHWEQPNAVHSAMIKFLRE